MPDFCLRRRLDFLSPDGGACFRHVSLDRGDHWFPLGNGLPTVAVRDPGDLFAPPDPLFMPGSAVDGHVLAFASAEAGFLEIHCKLARAPLAARGYTWMLDLVDSLSLNLSRRAEFGKLSREHAELEPLVE